MGRELDSLADVISFGVAPAIIAYGCGMQGLYDRIVLAFFVACGVSRLARYNVTAETLSEGTDKVKYFEGTPVIREIKRVSKPGRRVYMASKDLPSVRNGLGISIVSTPKGVMSDANARAANVGGEVLCTVF